jgi:hypothetical protein
MKNLGIRQTPLKPRRPALMFSLAEQPTFGRLSATRFRSTNRSRNGFHRVAPATLEDAVLESSHARVYTLQIHAFATCRAARTFGRQQLRYSTPAHGHSPSELSLPPSELSLRNKIYQKLWWRLYGIRQDQFGHRTFEDRPAGRPLWVKRRAPTGDLIGPLYL